MNTLLVIGIILMFSGLLLVLISEIMIAHYDRKLYKLNQVERNRKEIRWIKNRKKIKSK
jgi:hypothetical protein